MLNPYDVLKDFRPDEVQYLVNSAIFDEASFSRVRFHRSIREYLAACWVNRLLTNGQALPLVQVLPLFAVESCSQWIVFQGRMATLSWLAAINVQVREWVVRACPVLLMHDGDPQAWDQASVETAFSQLIDNATSTPMVVDFRSFSGEMRAGQAVGGAAVAAVLARPNLPWQAFSLAMRLARTAKLQETAVPVYAIYRDQSQLESHRAAALTVLQEVGLQEHRAQILADIQSSTLMSNTLLGEALPATRWQSLGVDQLALILGRSADEGDTGTGPMASAIKNDMLSDADLSGATLLLSAVLRSLPRAEAGKPFARYPQESAPKRAWLLHVLPDCFKRVLELSRDAQNPPTAVCAQAAQEVYELRDSGYANADDVTALRTLIQHFQALRWEIALALARLGQPALDRGRMGWDKGMLVGFDGDDLPELTRRAQDSALPAETRDVWFSIALEVAIRQPQRLKVLRQLCEATAGENRAEILERLKGWRKGERSRQRWEADDQARRVKQRQDKEAVVACFEPRLGGIADGTDVAGLRDLLRRVFNTKAWGERGELDFRFISPLFTPQIAEAFAVGLKRFWRTYDPADPMDHPNGTLPTDALLALAGVYAYAESGGTFIEVTDDEAARAAGVSVWASSAPPSWFKQLYAAKPGPVVAALNPRVLREARAPHASHGALDLALRAASAARRPLLAHVQHLIVGDEVVNQAMVKKLIPLLVEDGLLSMVEVGSVCRRKLELTPAGVRIQDLSWLRLWADAQPREACDWFNARLPGLGGESQAQVADFAAEMSATHWVKEPRDQEAVDLLLEVCGVVRQHHSSNASSAGAHESFFGPPTSRFLHSAAQGFVRLRGRLGRFGLQKLHDEEHDDERRWELKRLLAQHAEQDASTESNWSPDRLRGLHAAFDTDPASEAQLFQQVMARLEAIKADVEHGRFSERVLFDKGVPEPHLQLWLAAKFEGAPGRRFSVHREEELDLKKKPDVRCSFARFNTCVEIKPLDATRKYTATTLVDDTLKVQMVQQYLKEAGSRSGILVLVQLDHKRWDLPGAPGSSFDALVRYVQGEANRIKQETPTVIELQAVGMRFVV